MTALPTRVKLLTFHKCGSQWVRDVLTAPEIADVSGLKHVSKGWKVRPGWPEQPVGTIAGPIYSTSRIDWEYHRSPGDRAVVVLRDPRDRLISWVFSFAYSHADNPATNIIRPPLLALDQRHRLMIGLFEFKQVAKPFRSWFGAAGEHEYIARYEQLVADGAREFRAIFDFLGWQVPDETLRGVIKRLSFRERSGRTPGETDVHSHYRRGVAGDWRNHFDRELGELFEAQFPGLLVSGGFESDPDWPARLESKAEPAAESDGNDRQAIALRAEVARLREERDELRRICGELQRQSLPR